MIEETKTRTLPSVAGQSVPREGAKPAESAETRPMSINDTGAHQPIDRDEPNDDPRDTDGPELGESPMLDNKRQADEKWGGR